MSSSEKEDLDLESGNGNGNHHASSSSTNTNTTPTERHVQRTQTSSQNYNSSKSEQRHHQPFLPWLREHFTWSWFTAPQSTGGISALLSLCPKTFHGLHTIGLIIFIFNLVLLSTFLTFAFLRFASSKPSPIRAFLRSLVTPPECYFFGSVFLACATVIICTERYAVGHTGDWVIVAIRVVFWIYAAMALMLVIGQFVAIFQHTPFKSIQFAPPMIITILSAMLTGTVAAAISENQPPHYRLPIIVAGVAYQGLGWLVCMICLTMCMSNLLENGWPAPNLRPGLFVMVGTSGFTIIALIGMARASPEAYAYFAKYPNAKEILLIIATWTGVFLWLFSFWVFGLAVVINLVEVVKRDEESGKLKLNVTWTNAAWAGIFPNVGWTLGTIYLGQEFDSEGILWVSVAMTIALVVFWLLDLVMMAKKGFTSYFVDSRIKLA